jgi:hypothetical protein
MLSMACFNDIIYKIALCNRSFVHYNKATHKICFLAKSTEKQAIATLNEDPGLPRLFWGVVVFRHHVIIGIEMLSKWRHPSIVDRILKLISFPYPHFYDRHIAMLPEL